MVNTGMGKGEAWGSEVRVIVILHSSPSNRCYLLDFSCACLQKITTAGLGNGRQTSQKGCGGSLQLSGVSSHSSHSSHPLVLNSTLICMWPWGLAEGLEYIGWKELKEEGSVYPAVGKAIIHTGCSLSSMAALGSPMLYKEAYGHWFTQSNSIIFGYITTLSPAFRT